MAAAVSVATVIGRKEEGVRKLHALCQNSARQRLQEAVVMHACFARCCACMAADLRPWNAFQGIDALECLTLG